MVNLYLTVKCITVINKGEIMIEVQVHNPCDAKAFDKAFKKFKRLVKNDGFLQQIQKDRYYKKQSQINHEKDQQRIRHMEIEKTKKKDY